MFQSFSRNDANQSGLNFEEQLPEQSELNYQPSEMPTNSYAPGYFHDRPMSPKSTSTRPHIELTDVDSMVDMVF